MPAESEAQRRLMAAARSYKRGTYKGEPSDKIKELAESMSDEDLTDFMTKEVGGQKVEGTSRFITTGELREASKRYCEEHDYANADEAMEDIYRKQTISKVATLIKHAASCRARGERAMNRAVHAKSFKDAELNGGVKKNPNNSIEKEASDKESLTEVDKVLANPDIPEGVKLPIHGIDTINRGINLADRVGTMASNTVKGAAKGGAIGAGVGAVGGAGLGAALTWLLKNKPELKDYLTNAGIGAAGGAVLGSGAGIPLGAIQGLGKEALDRSDLATYAGGGLGGAGLGAALVWLMKNKPELHDYASGTGIGALVGSNAALLTKTAEDPGAPGILMDIDAAVSAMHKTASGKQQIKLIEGLAEGAANTGVGKKLKSGVRRVLDMFTSSAPGAKGPEALELGISGVGAGGELARSEYYRRKDNNASRAAFDKARSDLVGKRTWWLPEHFSEEVWEKLQTGQEVEPFIVRALEARGYVGPKKDFDAARQLGQAGLVGASVSPKYTRWLMKLPGSKAIAHAKKTKSPSEFADWATRNIPDWQMRAAGGAVSTAALHQAHRIKPALGSVLTGMEAIGGIGEAGEAGMQDFRKTTETLKGASKKLTGDGEKGQPGVVDKISAAADNMNELGETIKTTLSPDAIKKRVREGAGEVLGGLTEGAKTNIKAMGDWIKANPGAASGIGAAGVGSYLLWKLMDERAKKKDMEEQARLQAALLKQVM